MKRRSFLKSVLAAAGAVLSPKALDGLSAAPGTPVIEPLDSATKPISAVITNIDGDVWKTENIFPDHSGLVSWNDVRSNKPYMVQYWGNSVETSFPFPVDRLPSPDDKIAVFVDGTPVDVVEMTKYGVELATAPARLAVVAILYEYG